MLLVKRPSSASHRPLRTPLAAFSTHLSISRPPLSIFARTPFAALFASTCNCARSECPHQSILHPACSRRCGAPALLGTLSPLAFLSLLVVQTLALLSSLSHPLYLFLFLCCCRCSIRVGTRRQGGNTAAVAFSSPSRCRLYSFLSHLIPSPPAPLGIIRFVSTDYMQNEYSTTESAAAMASARRLPSIRESSSSRSRSTHAYACAIAQVER